MNLDHHKGLDLQLQDGLQLELEDGMHIQTQDGMQIRTQNGMQIQTTNGAYRYLTKKEIEKREKERKKKEKEAEKARKKAEKEAEKEAKKMAKKFKGAVTTVKMANALNADIQDKRKEEPPAEKPKEVKVEVMPPVENDNPIRLNSSGFPRNMAVGTVTRMLHLFQA